MGTFRIEGIIASEWRVREENFFRKGAISHPPPPCGGLRVDPALSAVRGAPPSRATVNTIAGILEM